MCEATQGMEQGPTQGMEHGPTQGMEQGPTQGMEQGPTQGMEHGPTLGYGTWPNSRWVIDTCMFLTYKALYSIDIVPVMGDLFNQLVEELGSCACG